MYEDIKVCGYKPAIGYSAKDWRLQSWWSDSWDMDWQGTPLTAGTLWCRAHKSEVCNPDRPGNRIMVSTDFRHPAARLVSANWPIINNMILKIKCLYCLKVRE